MVAVGMIWYYEEGNTIDSCIKFRSSNSTYSLYSWTEPNFDLIQTEVKQQTEKAVEIEPEIIVEKPDIDLEKKRLEEELKQAQIEKEELAQKLQAEKWEKEKQKHIADRAKEQLIKQTEEPDNPFDEKIVGGYSGKIFLYGGGGLFALAILYAAFFRKSWQ